MQALADVADRAMTPALNHIAAADHRVKHRGFAAMVQYVWMLKAVVMDHQPAMQIADVFIFKLVETTTDYLVAHHVAITAIGPAAQPIVPVCVAVRPLRQ